MPLIYKLFEQLNKSLVIFTCKSKKRVSKPLKHFADSRRIKQLFFFSNYCQDLYSILIFYHTIS